ncbi:MAG: HAD hydrolase family protein [Gammaproteobacteria bacterium]|nr:HAD hydrolase family protein [Gammaproteobacteria bacterium]
MANYVALVPLRGGSKSIPDKNIRLIAGKPLCAWVLQAACLSGIFDKVIVSTDSAKIADVVQSLGLPVEVLHRPAELATDEASTEAVMLHAAQVLEFDVLATIQATSPLVQPEDFQKAYDMFQSSGYDSLLTAVRSKRFFWNDDGTALNYRPQHRPRRQDFAGSLMENGAFYFTKRSILEQTNCRLGGSTGIYEMAAESAVEIDEPDDWRIVERTLLDRSRQTLHEILKNISLLVVDVDGTLTDAGMYWSAEGDQLKKFNTRDAKGLELVRKTGVEVAIITSENSPIVTARASKLGIQHCFIGVEKKQPYLEALACKLSIELTEVAYIGDDINDLDCLKIAGFSACPADAVEAVTTTVQYVSKHAGGMGAVRDICELICAAHAAHTTN